MKPRNVKPIGSVGLLILSSVSFVSLAAAPASRPGPFDARLFDFQSILHNPPVERSSAHIQEVQSILRLQSARLAADEQRCKEEKSASVFIFSQVLGRSFNGSELPQTAELMQEVSELADSLSDAAARHWNRQSPSSADSRIHPCVKVSDADSYPSAQAVRGMVWATLLSGIYPGQRDQLMALGRQIGQDSVMAGENYPSDVEAGQKLAVEIVRRLLADDSFLDRLDEAREECQD